jgi:DNA-binding CsgD family transcriptional regulator
MDSLSSIITDFVNRANQLNTIECLNNEFERIVNRFGIVIFSCTELARPGGVIMPRPLFGRLQPDWMLHYSSKRYGHIDPALHSAIAQTRIFQWSDLQHNNSRRVEHLFGEAKDALGDEGIVVPIHGPRGQIHVVIMNGDKIDKSPETLPALRLAAMYYAEVGVELHESYESDSDHLTLSTRQIDCLNWAAEGKSDWEIGEILSISENTVHRHIENAKKTLGVSTRMQAVVLCLRARAIISG